MFRTDHNKIDCFEQCMLCVVKSYKILLFEHPENLCMLCIFGVAFQVIFLDHEDLLCFIKNLCFPGHTSALFTACLSMGCFPPPFICVSSSELFF